MDLTKFKNLLDEQVSWPDYYSFKFIVKVEHKTHVTSLLEEHEIIERHSRNGKFVSINSKKLMESSDDVVAVYHKLSTIEGVITL